jgi:hypothetical protein
MTKEMNRVVEAILEMADDQLRSHESVQLEVWRAMPCRHERGQESGHVQTLTLKGDPYRGQQSVYS